MSAVEDDSIVYKEIADTNLPDTKGHRNYKQDCYRTKQIIQQ